MTLLDNYRVSKLILYRLGDLLLEGSARWLSFCILLTNSHLSLFYVCQLTSIRMLAVCSFGSRSISCSIKSPCNILYKTSYLHLFIFTLTLSGAQEALRLLAFGRDLGRSFGLHIIRHNSLFGIYRQLFLYHSITLVCSAFDWCSLIWSELVLALLGIIRHCLVMFGITQHYFGIDRYHLASLRWQSTSFLTTLSTFPLTQHN